MEEDLIDINMETEESEEEGAAGEEENKEQE